MDSKVNTTRTNDEVVCLAVFFYVLPRHTNIMTDKGFNIFDECTHLSPQEEECISSSGGDIKMYASGSIANSRRMLTEINEISAIARIRI